MSGVRGKGGGYRLTRKPEEYTAAEILSVAELGASAPWRAWKGGRPCPRADQCRTLPCGRASIRWSTTISATYTLKDLVDQTHQTREASE